MPQYAILTPKEGAEPPKNTGRGWMFQYDSAWHPIGPEHPYPLEVGEHALAFFTQRPADLPPVPLVDMEVFEGQLTLQAVGRVPEHTCPVPGCSEIFTDVGELSQHIVECATRSTEERLTASAAKGRGRKAADAGTDTTEQDETRREETEGVNP